MNVPIYFSTCRITVHITKYEEGNQALKLEWIQRVRVIHTWSTTTTERFRDIQNNPDDEIQYLRTAKKSTEVKLLSLFVWLRGRSNITLRRFWSFSDPIPPI